jgi:hypothetical protein
MKRKEKKKSHKNGKVLASALWYGIMIVAPRGRIEK